MSLLSPHTALHTLRSLSTSVHVHPSSTVKQSDVQPSESAVLPSSHVSVAKTSMESPHVVTHVESLKSAPEHDQPDSITHPSLQPSSLTRLSSSHYSKPGTLIPSPHVCEHVDIW